MIWREMSVKIERQKQFELKCWIGNFKNKNTKWREMGGNRYKNTLDGYNTKFHHHTIVSLWTTFNTLTSFLINFFPKLFRLSKMPTKKNVKLLFPNRFLRLRHQRFMWETTSQHSRICQLQRQNYLRLFPSSLQVILSPFVSFFSLLVCCNFSVISDLWSNTFPPFQHTFHDLNVRLLVFFFAKIIA